MRQAALVSDESALEVCVCSRRCAIQIDDLYLYLWGEEGGGGEEDGPCTLCNYISPPHLTLTHFQNSSTLYSAASAFKTIAHWHKLGEVKNECTPHNFIVLATFAPKIIKVGRNLTKLWWKQFCFILLSRGVYQIARSIHVNELLHAHQTDKMRTNAENRDLVNSFSTFFVSKISGLKSAVSSKLASISNPISFQDSSHTCPLLHTCQPVTIAEVLRILHSVLSKSSSVDLVPSCLVKSCATIFAELIAELANHSFSNGCFPACFKHAVIMPLLKKPTLDTSNPSRYRPISNLDFISKISERLFLVRFQPHILACSNFNHHQSAYRLRHSTETSLLSTL